MRWARPAFWALLLTAAFKQGGAWLDAMHAYVYENNMSAASS